MSIGERLKRLRQGKNWSQAQLAKMMNTHQKQISKYERGVNLPSTEVLIKLSKIYNVSIDFLINENPEDNISKNIADRELLQKLAEIDKLSEHDKSLIKGILDAFIKKHLFEEVAAK